MKHITLLFLFVLFSCATSIQEEDCQKNMRDSGFQDASRGLSSSMFHTYKKYCEWKDIDQKKASYIQGYKEGTKGYCVRRQGLMIAEAGRPFPQQCKSFKEFSYGFAEGKKKALKKRAQK
jgi:hypothetical protein